MNGAKIVAYDYAYAHAHNHAPALCGREILP